MKRIWKQAAGYVAVVALSAGATFATYSMLEANRGISTADTYNYGAEFNQKGVKLAALTPQGYPDFTKPAENSVHAVVHIKAVKRATQIQQRRQVLDPLEFFFGFGDSQVPQQQARPSVGFGSGVIISEDGYIVTNNHVIQGADELEVTLNDNRKFKAKLIGTDAQTDIALLKVEATKLPYIPFGNSDALKVGEWVLAVGNPFNLTSTVTAGIVSAKGRGLSGGAQQSIESYIQTDAAVNRGNSGGALVNVNGELVGINTAIYSQTGDFAGYSFAVPISIAGKVVADLKQYGVAQRPMLGVSITDVAVAKEIANSEDNPRASEFALAKNLKLDNGIFIGGFAERSPAKEAGLEVGDVIVSINGSKVTKITELMDYLNRFRPGDKVKIGYVRNGATKEAVVTLINNSGNTDVVKKVDGLSELGAAFKDLSNERKRELGISSGVEVAGVDTGGKLAKAGIKKGFIIMKINNTPIILVSQLEHTVQSIAKSDDKGVFIAGFYPTDKRMRYIAIDLNE